MQPIIPETLKYGHENLRYELTNMISHGGELGEKAKLVNDAVLPHFKKEEDYALPPLGLLCSLSQGLYIESDVAISMADTLKSELSELKEEHNDIENVLSDLKVVADKEDNDLAKKFIKDLTDHVRLEDEILYPTTILIGNYLRNFKKQK